MLDVLRGYGIHGRTEVIPTGLPSDELPEGDGRRFRAAHGIDQDRPLLLYVGRVAHEKNIDFLLRVTQQLRGACPDILLVIAGEGPAERSLRQLAEQLDLGRHIHFVGYLSRGQALADCYAAGDVFVFASRTETQGLVLLEAMKLGTPVVTTAVMGTASIMADRRGGLVAKEDVIHFAGQCLALLRDAALRQRHAQQARRKAADWSAPVMAERMLDLYERLITGKTAATPLDPVRNFDTPS
jgi:glycosyltransferase involved in cell wall biosynthesis